MYYIWFLLLSTHLELPMTWPVSSFFFSHCAYSFYKYKMCWSVLLMGIYISLAIKNVTARSILFIMFLDMLTPAQTSLKLTK